jgi:hypothetical protein
MCHHYKDAGRQFNPKFMKMPPPALNAIPVIHPATIANHLPTIPLLLGETITAWEAVIGICPRQRPAEGRASGRERVNAGMRADVLCSRRD